MYTPPPPKKKINMDRTHNIMCTFQGIAHKQKKGKIRYGPIGKQITKPLKQLKQDL